jgi:hypothetical protein
MESTGGRATWTKPVRVRERINRSASNLSKAGWSWGCVSAIDSSERTIWIADAHRDDGKRFVVRADELLTALELRSMPARACAGSSKSASGAGSRDAQLSAPALHLPTPKATGGVERPATAD